MNQPQIGSFSPEVHSRGTQGPIVVLVHGSASDRRTWEAQIEPLSDKFQVVTYSRRYHWPNPQADDATDYSMTTHVNDLVELIGSLGADQVHLVGHSYGGFVALQASIRHPGLVRSQVLIEPPVVPLFLSDPPRPVEILKVLLKRPALGTALVKFGASGIVPATKAAKRNEMDEAIRILGTAILGKNAFSQLSSARWEQVKANNIKAEYLTESFDSLTSNQVKSVGTPTLLVSGSESPRLWPLLTNYLHELLPASERVEISAASHIVHEDNSGDFNAALIDFLAAQSH